MVTAECEVDGTTADLTEIRYLEAPAPSTHYHYPGNGVKAILCPTHLGQRIKRLDAEGTGYTLKGLAETDPYPLYYEIMEPPVTEEDLRDYEIPVEMLDHDYYDEDGNPL